MSLCCREQERAKKMAKAVKGLERYLRSTINLNKSTSYDDYKSMIDKQSDFISIPEEHKQKAFTEVL